MIKIIRPRQSGKTSELIRISENRKEYIAVATKSRANCLFRQAQEMGAKIPYPITLNEVSRGAMQGTNIRNILIDDADAVLKEIFRGTQIDVITMTNTETSIQEREPGEGCEFCEIPGKLLDVIEQPEPRIFVGLSGAYIQIYDEDYPGFIENIPIKFCPICGREL